MKNDIDLIRAILTAVRDRNDLQPKAVTVPDFDPMLVARHVERLTEDGMLDGISFKPLSRPVSDVLVRDLTTDGHNFLAALEAQDVWARLKSALSPTELGALSLKKLAGLAGELAEKAIRKKLGLD
ncbi:DUF2513 domain-containing protein [Rhodobacter sp. KR11]|uniref:DUF2513 domain-containing protein n=1 Tax=Rhodobacter sp. KR11 TaxID=2974588 RepID=UPI002222C06F|nr:DUF2513 domain-containing protein [Rhodobacter sp. KR11]MCW1920843.1 DUF2513 domain-containing protein [Rhodobacter sp. KR11]